MRRAVTSVLEQTWSASKIVIVDDGSTQDLLEIRKWAEDHGCQWNTLSENKGPAAARNFGVGQSNADWIAFLDSDDVWLPDKLKSQSDWHRQNPDTRISQVRETWIREGKAIGKPAHWEPGEGDVFEAACQRCVIGPSCVMIRRDLWDLSGGFDPRFRVCEDFELWLRICRNEAVGLVPGEAQVEKHGGHSDQLSMQVPAMDRYRILALLKLISGGELSLDQNEIAIGAVREKAKIIANGAAKRGMDRREELYSNLAAMDLAGLSEEPNPVVSALWDEVAGD